jgi:hypothetical protein
MAQRKPRDTWILAVRVPIPFAKRVYDAAGGQDRFAEWARVLFEAAVAGKAPGPGALQAQGYQEGRRQGWSYANRVFRAALEQAAAELRKNSQ